jgi:Ser/Thr protein kinase RdoA (MazF antagonist)
LAALGAPVPALLAVHDHALQFEHVTGNHARPGDLPVLAHLLGTLHRLAHTRELHRARLDRPHHTGTGTGTGTGMTIPDFLTRRRPAITRLLNARTVPEPTLTLPQALAAMEKAATGPACFYKDSNPRNFLLTPTGPVLIDFDVLTLAPAGYDLAKLLVTLTMTHGDLPADTLREALASYNTALTHQHDPPTDQCTLRPVLWRTLMTWAGLHHILTSPYRGRGGYRHGWSGPPK